MLTCNQDEFATYTLLELQQMDEADARSKKVCGNHLNDVTLYCRGLFVLMTTVQVTCTTPALTTESPHKSVARVRVNGSQVISLGDDGAVKYYCWCATDLKQASFASGRRTVRCRRLAGRSSYSWPPRHRDHTAGHVGPPTSSKCRASTRYD